MTDESKVPTDGEPQIRTLARDTGRSNNPDGKRQGHIAELAFMHKSAELGFGVTKPCGDVEHYDFILDSGCRLWRVQVKSTYTRRKVRRCYCIQPTHGFARKLYTSDEVDFLVAYIVPLRAWYVIPILALSSVPRIYLYPDNPQSTGQFERYRDAWCLMACPRHGPPRPEVKVDRLCSSSDHCPLTTNH
jgi:PD-(D/E)XK endonuclease